MHVNCVTVHTSNCHIYVYSKMTSEKLIQYNNKLQIFAYTYFPVQQQFPVDIIKADHKFIHFLRTDSLFFVGFLCLWLMFPLSLSEPRNNFQDTNQYSPQPTLAHKCTIFSTFDHTVCFISSVYWHRQNLHHNYFKMDTYPGIYVYVRIILVPEYSNIQYVCMYVSY
jgi:hypothetical protein